MPKRAARRAVSPVLATLMMVAVAVAMSVIIFTWSQGFLSQTGEAASAQQAAQNVAAQSGILIEAVTFSGSNQIIAYVRNVGAATVTVDSAEVVIRTAGATKVDVQTSLGKSIDPRDAESVTITLSGGITFSSGDVVTVKLITTVGTFAQATYTVP